MGRRLSPSADESQLLDHVDLVNSAVTTLARVHKDNEVHKMLISHLTREAVEENQGGSDRMPPEPLDNTLCLPSIIVSALTPQGAGDAAGKDKADQDSQGLSQAEIKRDREKKRRNGIRKGLDKMMEMILVIDPLLKVMLEERAETLRAVGSTSTTKDGQLLSHVEIVNHAVAILARIHSQNEIHKNVIARMARAHTSSGDTRNVASLTASSSIAMMPPPPNRPPARGANLLGNNNDDHDTGMNHQYDNGTTREQSSFDAPTEASPWEETLLSDQGHESGRKRFKSCQDEDQE